MLAISSQVGTALKVLDMIGSLVPGELIVRLNSFPGRTNVNRVNLVTSARTLMLQQLQENVMLGFSVTMVLTKDSLLEDTKVMLESVQVVTIVSEVIQRPL